MQRIDAGAVVLADRDVIRLARLAVAGLPVIARRDGALTAEDQRLVAELEALSRQVRARVERQTRRSTASPRTSQSRPADLGAPSDPSTLVSIKDAAAMYQVDESLLRRMCRQGRLAARRDVRGKWGCDRDALASWAIGRTST